MNQGVTFPGKNGPITVIPVNTGLVSMKRRAHTIRHHNFGLRVADVALDKEFTAYLPVLCWVVQHPEGVFLIDTGYSPLVNEPDYFSKANALEKWFSRTQVRAKIRQEEELVRQLPLLGIQPSQIDSVILTHLHVDHVGGIAGLRGCKFIVHALEYANNSQAFLLPGWFNPVKISLDHPGPDDFPKSAVLTACGDMHLVFTPGHTKGHCSVLLQTNDVDLLFAGDLVYSIEQLTEGTFAAPNDVKTSRQTYQAVQTYARQRPTILLPSHDMGAVERLSKSSLFA